MRCWRMDGEQYRGREGNVRIPLANLVCPIRLFAAKPISVVLEGSCGRSGCISTLTSPPENKEDEGKKTRRC